VRRHLDWLARLSRERGLAVVEALLTEVRPDLIFVAGDLSDPHGTHRMCKQAIDQALERCSLPRA
jgi:glucosamine-6-phosphate deaminase